MTRILSRLLSAYALRCAWLARQRKPEPPVYLGFVIDGLLNEDGTPYIIPLDGSSVANGNDVMITWTNTEPRIFQI